jgi:hypothetical protein
MDAIRANWPAAKVMFFHGAWVSEPASFSPTRFDGNNVAWANELVGPFVIGFVSSALGSEAQVIDGTELYTQRSLTDFQHVYRWAKSGFARSGGRIVPAGDVSAAEYEHHISVAQAVYDMDMLNGYGALSPAEVQRLVGWSLKTSDSYAWMYTEAYDWRATGWPSTQVPADYLVAVEQARQSWPREHHGGNCPSGPANPAPRKLPSSGAIASPMCRPTSFQSPAGRRPTRCVT